MLPFFLLPLRLFKTTMKKISLLVICVSFLLGSVSFAQSELPDREVRAAWIATVINLDWPSGSTQPEEVKKSDLKNKLISLKAAGINTVYFQVRAEGDALYDSPYEPWSKYLTGEEGVAPDPYWDPLAFAIEEAHKLGMELHAWLNPYRAMRSIPSDYTQKEIAVAIDESVEAIMGKEYDANAPKFKLGTTERDSMHVANKHPEWIMVMNAGTSGSIAITDPGLQEVRDYVTMIIMDIVNRYDVDGIHFDDYFYPYPPNHMAANSTNNALDDSSFALQPRGFTNKDEWRRNNVEIFITQLNDSIKTAKPWVKFGISPFGIHRNGVPFGISGLDAYTTLYIDALKWVENGDVDYLLPQLYWQFGGGQDFAKLADWWAEEVAKYGRHLYTGHGAYRSDKSTYTGSIFKATEIPRQLEYARNNPDIQGSSIFRMKNITTYYSQGLRDSLITNYYRKPAIVPTMDWLDTSVVFTPTNIVLTPDEAQQNKFTLTWDRPVSPLAKSIPTAPADTLLNFAIYRVDSEAEPDVNEVISNPENRIGLTGLTTFTDIVETGSEGRYYYVVTAVSRNGVESEPSEPQDAGVVVSNEEEKSIADNFSLNQNYPNPFNPTTTISFKLGKTGLASLKVYDVLGREVATLVNGRLAQGEHTFNFDASAFASGVYIYQLKSNGVVLTRKLTLIK